MGTEEDLQKIIAEINCLQLQQERQAQEIATLGNSHASIQGNSD